MAGYQRNPQRQNGLLTESHSLTFEIAVCFEDNVSGGIIAFLVPALSAVLST